jgi:Na+/H+ antiporter NhaD/arsenite permease-like protein
MTTGLSAIMGNDPVILSGTAFLIYFTKVAEVSPVAWMFSEFASCNTASMLLFVGISIYGHDADQR